MMKAGLQIPNYIPGDYKSPGADELRINGHTCFLETIKYLYITVIQYHTDVFHEFWKHFGNKQINQLFPVCFLFVS